MVKMSYEESIYMKFNVRKIIGYDDSTDTASYSSFFKVFAVLYNTPRETYLSLIKMSNDDTYCLDWYEIDNNSNLHNRELWEFELIHKMADRGYEAFIY
jgi:hypothetical protein